VQVLGRQVLLLLQLPLLHYRWLAVAMVLTAGIEQLMAAAGVKQLVTSAMLAAEAKSVA
jgi:hypothetical protein